MQIDQGLFAELAELMSEITSGDVARSFEARGMFDHDGLRQFAYGYGDVIAAESIEEVGMPLTQAELADRLGTAMIGGFYLGLAWARENP